MHPKQYKDWEQCCICLEMINPANLILADNGLKYCSACIEVHVRMSGSQSKPQIVQEIALQKSPAAGQAELSNLEKLVFSKIDKLAEKTGMSRRDLLVLVMVEGVDAVATRWI